MTAKRAEDRSDGALVLELMERIKPLLAHRGPEIQGGVLVNLVAMWLAGNVCIGEDAGSTAELRESLLQVHIQTVRDLLPVYAKEIEAMVEGMKQ